MRLMTADSDGDDTLFGQDSSDTLKALQALDLRTQRKRIRQELTDPYNRLHSIALDAHFVDGVSKAYPDFAVLANLRCGSWYVDPEGERTVSEPIYFKSIDGHMNEWSFSMRRPNLGLLHVLQNHHGAIVVDSTRRGKRFPDALSKTVPIWCAVINRAMALRYPEKCKFTPSDVEIYTPSVAVSESERHQIRKRLDTWSEDLAKSSYTLPPLTLPLRPLHLSPATTMPSEPLRKEDFPVFHPVICLSASRYTGSSSSERMNGFNYVPGSGDDHESWLAAVREDSAEGPASLRGVRDFGPSLFWKNRDAILACKREELVAFLRQLLLKQGIYSEEPLTSSRGRGKVVQLGTPLINFETSFSRQDRTEGVHTIVVEEAKEGSSDTPGDQEPRRNVIKVATGPKKHLNAFSSRIPGIVQAAGTALQDGQSVSIVVQDTAGKNGLDVGIGVALILLTLHFDDNHALRSSKGSETEQIGKATVSRRLEWIINSSLGQYNFNPSRSILKRVNDYIFTQR